MPGGRLHVGVVWYLCPDESHNRDGRHTGYLDTTPANCAKYRVCDPSLYDALQRLVAEDNRNITAVRQSGVLPDNALYYEPSLSYRPDKRRAARQAAREGWLAGALEATTGADVIFVDPDNGIASEKVDPLAKTGPKYVFLDDLRLFTQRGQSLVIYHHLGRQSTAAQQIERGAANLQQNLGLSDLPRALWYHRGTARVYFIVEQPRPKLVIEGNLSAFLNGPWCRSNHFELVI